MKVMNKELMVLCLPFAPDPGLRSFPGPFLRPEQSSSLLPGYPTRQMLDQLRLQEEEREGEMFPITGLFNQNPKTRANFDSTEFLY